LLSSGLIAKLDQKQVMPIEEFWVIAQYKGGAPHGGVGTTIHNAHNWLFPPEYLVATSNVLCNVPGIQSLK
jgi:hypothetical protein